MTSMDREWVESLAGRPVTDQEVVEFLSDFNDWLDRRFFDLESPEYRAD